MAFGSDWPVAPPNPLLGVYAAVHRKAPQEPQEAAFYPAEAVSGEQALRASTIDAARLSGLQENLGSLKCVACCA